MVGIEWRVLYHSFVPPCKMFSISVLIPHFEAGPSPTIWRPRANNKNIPRIKKNTIFLKQNFIYFNYIIILKIIILPYNYQNTKKSSTGIFMAGNYIAFDTFQVHVL
jgi:hypothetical protein